MIRQLRRLTRPVTALGGGAIAIAVYAHPADAGMSERAAAEQGFEGVACVDDAARAAILYIRLWQRYSLPWAREAAEGLLAFVRAMQTGDGAFANFILDWDGQQNLTTATSRPGDGPWVARAMHALAAGVSAFSDADCALSFDRGLTWLSRVTPYLDVRAVAVLAALEYWRATGSAELAGCAHAWANEIADAALGDVLPDRAGESRVHLWGHLQEAALAEAGMALQHPDLVEAARRSAEAVLVPPVEQKFPGPRAIPFDVSSVVRGLDAVGAATGEPRYGLLASRARPWFDGQNTAGAPVYDRAAGLVSDGIDDGRISHNSGAESNIEGGLALLGSLPVHLYEPSPPRSVAGSTEAETRGPKWHHPASRLQPPPSSRATNAEVSGR